MEEAKINYVKNSLTKPAQVKIAIICIVLDIWEISNNNFNYWTIYPAK
jgi:hypothetical protein